MTTAMHWFSHTHTHTESKAVTSIEASEATASPKILIFFTYQVYRTIDVNINKDN